MERFVGVGTAISKRKSKLEFELGSGSRARGATRALSAMVPRGGQGCGEAELKSIDQGESFVTRAMRRNVRSAPASPQINLVSEAAK